jgi:hypothetical protein
MHKRLWVCAWLAFGAGAAAGADEAGPGPGFQLSTLETPEVSPDGTIRVEQYFKPGDDYVFQFWTFDRHHGHPHLLNPGETGLMTGYGAGFRFTPDSQWLVRMQKVAAGESTLFLYRREGFSFKPATTKPLGDLAWDYFFSLPDSTGIQRSDLSPETILIKGVDDNYAWMGKHWPPGRYLVINLLSGESGTTTVGPWRCLYDMREKSFSVPPDFAAFNKKPWAGPWGNK